MTSTTKTWHTWLYKTQLFLFVLIVVCVLGNKFGLLPFRLSFFGFGVSLLMIICLGFGGLIAIGMSLFMGASQWRRSGVIALLLGLLPPLVIILIVGPANFGKPPIHDISTDLDNPPVFVVARSQRGPEENSLDHPGESLAQVQRNAYPHIKTLETSLAPAAAFERALAVTEDLGWELLSSDPSAGRIEAVDQTTFFGFKDDVVIRVSGSGQGSLVDVRSVSRVGQGDLGANAARIEKFQLSFDQPPAK